MRRRVFTRRWDTHHALHAFPKAGTAGTNEGLCLFPWNPGLLTFISRINLDQKLRHPPDFVRRPCQRIRQGSAIQTFDNVSNTHRIDSLIGLKSPDQM